LTSLPVEASAVRTFSQSKCYQLSKKK
jgi:hypothetical protein